MSEHRPRPRSLRLPPSALCHAADLSVSVCLLLPADFAAVQCGPAAARTGRPARQEGIGLHHPIRPSHRDHARARTPLCMALQEKGRSGEKVTHVEPLERPADLSGDTDVKVA